MTDDLTGHYEPNDVTATDAPGTLVALHTFDYALDATDLRMANDDTFAPGIVIDCLPNNLDAAAEYATPSWVA